MQIMIMSGLVMHTNKVPAMIVTDSKKDINKIINGYK